MNWAPLCIGTSADKKLNLSVYVLAYFSVGRKHWNKLQRLQVSEPEPVASSMNSGMICFRGSSWPVHDHRPGCRNRSLRVSSQPRMIDVNEGLLSGRTRWAVAARRLQYQPTRLPILEFIVYCTLQSCSTPAFNVHSTFDLATGTSSASPSPSLGTLSVAPALDRFDCLALMWWRL